MRTKKTAAILLTAAMASASLAGCGEPKGEDSGKSGGDETVTLTFATTGAEPSCQAQVLDAVNEKLKADGLNFQIDVKYLDDYWNKLALDIAGGAEYDLAWAHNSTLSDLVAKKVYQPITEALDSVGTELKEKTPDYVLSGGTVNGEVYAIPRIVPTTGYTNTFDVRKDLMDKYGIEKITTLEEMEQYLQAIYENEEGMIPYAGSNILPLMPVMGNYHYLLGDGAYALYVDPEDPELTVKNFWASDEFVQMCDKKREWEEKGWLSNDWSAIESPDNGFDYGKVGAVDSNVMRVSERVDSMANNVPEAEPYTVYLEPEKRWIFNAGDNMLAVPSTSKHPEEAVQFIQWIKCNQENYDLWSYGVEGVNYNKNGEAVDVSGIDAENVYSPNIWMWNDLDVARFSSNFPEDAIERLQSWDSESEASPLLGFTIDQTNIKSEVSQITAIMTEYSQNLAKGQVNIHDVQAEILEKMEAAGIDKVIEEVQKQVDAYAGK